jgi:hypothetical protein
VIVVYAVLVMSYMVGASEIVMGVPNSPGDMTVFSVIVVEMIKG